MRTKSKIWAVIRLDAHTSEYVNVRIFSTWQAGVEYLLRSGYAPLEGTTYLNEALSMKAHIVSRKVRSNNK